MDQKLAQLSKSTGTRVLQRAGMAAMEPMRKRAELIAQACDQVCAIDVQAIAEHEDAGEVRRMQLACDPAAGLAGVPGSKLTL